MISRVWLDAEGTDMNSRVLNAVDRLVLQVNFDKWLDAEGTDIAHLNDLLRRAFRRIHPRTAFCDVLSGARVECPPGGIKYGPYERSTFYRH